MMNMEKTNDELIRLAKEYVEKAEQDAQQNPTSDEIQVVVVEPTKKPYKKMMPNTIEAMNELVGGYIELIRIGNTETGGNIAMIMNEEGKLMGLPMNRIIFARNGVSDVLVGTFFITAYNMQGDHVSLNDAECERLIKRFKGMEVYF
jgi:hypothetical protein